jgi:hypothetical protein
MVAALAMNSQSSPSRCRPRARPQRAESIRKPGAGRAFTTVPTGHGTLSAPNRWADKRSFKTFEAAHSAAMNIKSRFPILQVSIYDKVRNSRTPVNRPSQSESRTYRHLVARKALRLHQKEISGFVHAQMQKHFWQDRIENYCALAVKTGFIGAGNPGPGHATRSDLISLKNHA